ncbi:MAG: ABC transporter ATP-binding protein [Candidatus Kapaibacterium sp.]
MKAIEAKELTKSYPEVTALDSIDFEVETNEVFGFIGPDGAGKTTLFRILTTLLVPDSGSAAVLGRDTTRDYRELRRLLGYMPGRFSLYEDLSVEENLRFFASIFKTTVEENYDLIREIYSQIEPFRDRRAGNLSGGMKQKLALSCALVHRPELLVLDEPTTGVDAVSRREFWDMLHRLKREGITIVVSTPYMDEASRCDRVALIQKGHILGIDRPENIAARFDKDLLAVRSNRKFELLEALRKYEYTESAYPFGDYFHYTDKRDPASPDDLMNHLKKSGIEDAEIKPIEPGIEDTFMRLMTEEEDGK